MDLSASWNYIELIAKLRLQNNISSNHISKYGEGIELMGAAGEILVRRYLGLPETIHETFDGGVDIRYPAIKGLISQLSQWSHERDNAIAQDIVMTLAMLAYLSRQIPDEQNANVQLSHQFFRDR